MDSASSPVARSSTWMDRRASGVLLHPTSLPGGSGVGDLGAAAHRFAAFLAEAGVSWWQMLPVGPIGPGNSPYTSHSSFAGNPLLIALDALAEDGLLAAADTASGASFPEARVDYAAAIPFKEERLRRAFARLDDRAPAALRHAFDEYLAEPPAWLREFALFTALAETRGGAPWWQWPAPLRDRDPGALAEARRELGDAIRYQAFLQFLFERQWRALAERCHALGVRLLGDLPIYVAPESAEVWTSRELFDLLPDGTARAVAGVPPDYFSAEGQRWGNPLFRWDEHERQGYAWWIDRLRASLARFDVVRLDHFIGFVNYWSVPSASPTAQIGRWVPGPGERFFARVREALGGLPFLAEDLGVVTPPVHELRERLGLPGMRVLQFSFAHEDDGPERYPEWCAAYTGTHDNDTVLGWLRELPERHEPDALAAWMIERERALAHIGGDGPEAHEKLVRLVFASPARLAVAPLQDVLGLGAEARMNRPGTARGNWEWRALPSQVGDSVATRLRSIVHDTGRASATPAPALG